ncbi:MAG: L-threonine 3-dehydrogenase [Bacillota bacterium]|nr:L-threonine 3-dehydrogenase [Bacillota bacterium]
MRALAKTAARTGAELIQAPVPVPGPRDALVKVQAASICGTDLHIYEWNEWAQGRIKPPMIFGHEMAGAVVEVGAGVTQVKVGDFVSAETHVVCDKCYLCRTGNAHICQNLAILGVDIDGVFAEYVSVPAANLWPTDTSIPADWASLQEPMGNAVHTTLAGDIVGKTVALFGCGPIGVIAVAVALSCGAERVLAVDINPYRLDLARKMGATMTINAMEQDPVAALRDATGGDGVDVFLEFSGAPSALRQGFAALRFGGWAGLLGLPAKPVELDVTNGIVFKGATVYGIAGRRMYDTWYKATALLRGGRVDLAPVITHRFPLEEFAKGFELMHSGQCGKVILVP